MKLYSAILFIALFPRILLAETIFEGKISFTEDHIAAGAPVSFKAQIMLKGQDYSSEIESIENLLKNNQSKNFNFFSIQKIAQSQNNYDVLEIDGGIVFLNTTPADSKVLNIVNDKIQILLKLPDIHWKDTTPVERPEIYRIILDKKVLFFIWGGLFLMLAGFGYLIVRKKRKPIEIPKIVIKDKVTSKLDVETLYACLVGELKNQQMALSQKNKYNEIIKNIDRIQYKRTVTAEELSRIETQLIEIRKEQNGNRIQ